MQIRTVASSICRLHCGKWQVFSKPDKNGGYFSHAVAYNKKEVKHALSIFPFIETMSRTLQK